MSATALPGDDAGLLTPGRPWKRKPYPHLGCRAAPGRAVYIARMDFMVPRTARLYQTQHSHAAGGIGKLRSFEECHGVLFQKGTQRDLSEPDGSQPTPPSDLQTPRAITTARTESRTRLREARKQLTEAQRNHRKAIFSIETTYQQKVVQALVQYEARRQAAAAERDATLANIGTALEMARRTHAEAQDAYNRLHPRPATGGSS